MHGLPIAGQNVPGAHVVDGQLVIEQGDPLGPAQLVEGDGAGVGVVGHQPSLGLYKGHGFPAVQGGIGRHETDGVGFTSGPTIRIESKRT